MAEAFASRELSDFGLAAVAARKDVTAGAIGQRLGIELEDRSGLQHGAGTALIGTGPGQWLVFVDEADSHWPLRLAEMLCGVASVSDQSSGYVITRLTGKVAPTVLQRGMSIDLDPAMFKPGASAASAIAYIPVHMWRVDDQTFDVAIPRSYAESFRHWLAAVTAAL
ncbi:sarcosine oxidase subunit gamma [Sphingopyxis sp. USTB-05]|uniref:sarcosine oxidase subunit gamma n=1 Tax=Sphingopyxis sp. USTB-05 TaxID=2830667 RepID=UPI002078E6DB|nr:sarcosine oxidase subunit gamma family protein [Sphingopyxis sp. USTB-05]USI77590.1 sarcosine oxidase subunit gamma [Sphingopyxis sp. USTB-05]